MIQQCYCCVHIRNEIVWQRVYLHSCVQCSIFSQYDVMDIHHLDIVKHDEHGVYCFKRNNPGTKTSQDLTYM